MPDYYSGKVAAALADLRDKHRALQEQLEAALPADLGPAIGETLTAAQVRFLARETPQQIRSSRTRIAEMLDEQARFINYVTESIEEAASALNRAYGTSGSVTFRGR